METRMALVAGAIAAWFWTQSLIGKRAAPAGIRDRLHLLGEPLNRYLRDHPRAADALLIVSSAFIDGLALFLLGSAIFGPSLRPLVGLVLLFGMRQLCQGLCELPRPEGALWRRPPIPSLLVTYDVATDFFFSGHTAVAVLGAIELAQHGGAWVGLAAALVAVFEAATVLVVRAHYTMDVFAGAVAAFTAAEAAARLAPLCDAALAAGPR